MKPDKKKLRLNADGMDSVRVFLEKNLVDFERAALKSKEMIALLPNQAHYNLLQYNKVATQVIRKMLADLSVMKPLEVDNATEHGGHSDGNNGSAGCELPTSVT